MHVDIILSKLTAICGCYW